MIIVYVITFIIYLLLSYLFVDSNLIYLKALFTNIAFQNRTFVSAIFLIVVSSQFLIYIYLLLRKLTFTQLKKPLLIIILVLLLSYSAILSYDIFNYILTAKVTYFYHENPYIVMPIEFANEPYLAFTRAANKLALYGPVWIVLSGVPFILGANNFIMIMFLFKIFVTSFFIGTIYLIWKMTKSKYSVVLFILNPLVLIETVGSGHNDIVMMFFALLSFFLFSKKRIALSIIALILSIFIKYATVFLMPVFIYLLYKHYKKETINWQKIYLYSFILMLCVFLLSFLREEIYPWYALWFFVFIPLIKYNSAVFYLTTAMLYGLMLRYLPFMYTGSYFGLTPILKMILWITPVALTSVYLSLKHKLWSRIRF